MRKYKIQIILITVILLIILTSASFYAIKNIAPYAVIKPYRSLNAELTSYLRSNYKKMVVTAEDSIKLTGYFIDSKTENSKGTIIILHGIGGSKESQLGIAEYFSLHGYNSIIFDLRAHGESEGLYCTYGYYEKYDVSRFIDIAESEFPDAGPIGIMGTSLGGAIAVQSMAADKRIKCGVVVSTFSSLNQIAYDYMTRLLFIPFRFVSDMALDEAGRIANFPTNEINPKDFAYKIYQPALIIHGTDDERINIKYGKEIFHNLKSPEKKFYKVKNANHDNINQVGGIKYQTEILDFLDKNL